MPVDEDDAPGAGGAEEWLARDPLRALLLAGATRAASAPIQPIGSGFIDRFAIETEGANDPWQLAQLERAFQLRQVRALCAAGARVADPARLDIRGEVTVGRYVDIDVNVVFEGRVELGDGVRIDLGSVLTDVQVAELSHIKPYSVL